MADYGNSNPKVIAAALAVAAVVGAGGILALNSNALPGLPGVSAKRETKPPSSSGGTEKNEKKQEKQLDESTPAGSVEAIVKLAENHDAAGFMARVNMDMAQAKGTDVIVMLYDSGDVKLPGRVRQALEGALADSIPEKCRTIAIDLGLVGTDFVGVGEVQDRGGQALVTVNLGGENLPNGYPLQLVMEKQGDKWNVISVENPGDFAKALRAGRNAAALRYVEQEMPFIKKYNESINALKAKYPALSAEYVNGYEAAEKELAEGYASLNAPLGAEELVNLRKKRQEQAREHIRLIRVYVAGDHSDALRQQMKDVEQKIDMTARNINITIRNFKR